MLTFTDKPREYRVRLHGPNLAQQGKGTFHVHAEGCSDNGQYGPGRRKGGEDDGGYPLTVTGRREIVDFVYGPGAGDFDGNDNITEGDSFDSDFHVAPCLADLPW
jgi:hypothetical protein